MAGVGKIVEKVAARIGPVVDELGFRLVDIDFLVERGRHILRIFADTEKGISLDECAFLSRELGNLIDVEDLIPHEYVLEVSSPGLDRPLKKADDFIRVLGSKVKLRLKKPVDGRRNFTGRLKTYEGEALELVLENGTVKLPVAEIEHANLVYEF